VYYSFNPGKIEPNSEESGIVEDQLTKQFANEFAAYIDVEHKITNKLNLQYGLRWSNFVRLGQDEVNVYVDDNPVVFDPFLLIYQGAEINNVDTSFSRSDKLATSNTIGCLDT